MSEARVAVLGEQQIAELVHRAVEEALGALDEVRSAPALVDRQGLARALSVSTGTVDALRRQGCPELRLGDAPRFEVSAVVEWLRERGRT